MLKIDNLHAAYGKVEVLHGISLDVPKGKLVTLIGSNGAGKTTTMRAISGMLKPRGGTVLLAGRDITGMDSHRIARAGLAHSPEGRRVFATMTVMDNLLLGAFPRFTRARPKGDVQHDLERALELFPRLKERRAQLAGTLSGGEQQMLALARALGTSPAILLIDELSMGLAPLVVQSLYDVVAQLVEEGISVLLVEQFARVVLTIADIAAIMLQGRVTEIGTPAAIESQLSAAYLGT